MKSLKKNLRELFRYPSAVFGLSIVLLLLIAGCLRLDLHSL